MRLKRYYGAGNLHFVTFSCWRRLALLGTPRRRDAFLRALDATRRSYRFIVVGYVVMPEHVHLLVDEPRRRNLSVALQALKQSVARRLLRRRRPVQALDLFAGGVALKHFWQRRFYDFNVYSEKKTSEKLRYMHRNPVKRGLVDKPEQWRWSSYRYYAFNEPGLVAINRGFALDSRGQARVG